ncbi:MAG: hypothetical protein WCV00_05150 [Verrucomicrobiia bacterium]
MGQELEILVAGQTKNLNHKLIMPLLFKEEYFATVRPYLPEDARRILDNQLPAIKKSIEAEVDKFAKTLGEEVKKEVEDFQKGLVQQQEEFLKKVTANFAEAVKKGASPDEIAAAGKALQTAVDDYKNQVKGWGETARKTLLMAVKAAGIPIPL